MLWHLDNITYFLWLNFLLFPENQPLQRSQAEEQSLHSAVLQISI